MVLHLTVPPPMMTNDFTPKITVIGVGGGGTNAVDNMIALELKGVEFVVANTDAQQLMHSRADRRIQLGPHITQGLGAGAKPEIGRAAAEEAADELYRHLADVHMVFVTAGMGGGTGTGAAPVIARMARERGILTVGVVTKPFTFEGARRARSAEEGIAELQQYVDTLIVIPNQNLFRLANERTGWKEAFKMADNVLYMGVRGVTDLMVAPGMVNLDFADIRTVMAEMGKAMMGTGEAEGENRAIRAAETAISNPLLEDNSMSGARGLLINITGGDDMTLFEVDQAANRIREEVDEEANIIFGSAIDDSLAGRIRVSVVATGINMPDQKSAERPRLVAVGGGGAAQAVASQAIPQQNGGGNPGIPGQPQALRPASGIPGIAPRPPIPAPRPLPLQPMARPAPAAEPEGRQPEYEPEAAPVAPPMMQAAEPISDENAYIRRPIPAHLQQPVRGDSAKTRAPGRPAGLFADPPRGDSGRAEQPRADAPPPRRSLFGMVTGALRNGLPAAQPHAASPQPHHHETVMEPAPQAPQANVRPAGGEDMGIEIPAFLRRQSS
jgi:cell division protein FtsZ